MLSIIVFTFDDEDYKVWLTQGIYRLSGYHLIIGGSFSTTVSLTPKLSAEHVRIVSAEGDIRLQAKNVAFQLAIKPLFRKSLIIKDLVIDDAIAKLDLRHFLKKKRDSLPLVVLVEHAVIHNTTLTLQTDKNTENTLKLDEFTITETKPDDLLTVLASGSINEREFSIDGKLGSLLQLYHPKEPYPVHIEAQSTNTRITIQGSIAEPLAGQGLDLIFNSETSDIRPLIDALGIDWPLSGKLSIVSTLSGDYIAPTLSNIELDLFHHKKYALYAKGSIDNILSGRNTNIQFHGTLDDARLIQPFLPDDAPLFRKTTFHGNLLKNENQYWIDNIAAHLLFPGGLEILAAGNTGIDNPTHSFPFSNLALNLTFSSPTTEAAKPFLIDLIPEMGSVTGSAQLISKQDGFALNKVDLTLGMSDGDLLTIKGSIGDMPFDSDSPFSKMNFDLFLHSSSSRHLSTIIDLPLPELGPVTVSGQFHGSENKSAINNISLEAGAPDQLHIESDGFVFLEDAVDKVTTQMYLNFRVSGNTKNALEALVYLDSSTHSNNPEDGEKRPKYSFKRELGRIKMTGILSSIDSTLGIEKLDLLIEKSNSFVLTSTGTIGDILNWEEVNVDYNLDAENLADVGTLANIEIPNLGFFKQTGRIISKESALNLVGAATFNDTHFSQELTLRTEGERPHLTGTLLIPVLHRSTISTLSSAFQTDDDEEKQLAETQQTDTFSRTPISLDFLDKINLNLGIYCNKLEGTEFTIDKVQTKLTLLQGDLKAKTEISGFEGGEATIDLHISPYTLPQFKLGATGNNVDIKKTLLLFNEDANAEGKAGFAIKIDGTGASFYDIASTLNGQIGVVVESGKIFNKNLSLLVFDFIGWLFNYAENKKSTEIDCAVMQFGFNSGKGESQTLFVRTPSLNAVGHSELDLRNESVDMLVNVHPIGRLLATTVPIQIRGSLNAPKVNIIPMSKAITTYGKLLFSPLGYLRSQVSKTFKAITGKSSKKVGACNLQEFSAPGAAEQNKVQ